VDNATVTRPLPIVTTALTAGRALVLVCTAVLLAACGETGATAAGAPTPPSTTGGSTASPAGIPAVTASDCQFQLDTGNGGSVVLDVTASTNCTSISDVLAGSDLTLTPTSGIDTSQPASCVQDFGGGIVASVYPDANSGDPEGDAESYCADVEAAQ
jgi:hypothetical protein